MNNITRTSVQKNKRKIQRKINIDTFQLQKICHHQCRCIRKNYESMITISQQQRTKTIDHMLHMKANIHKTTI